MKKFLPIIILLTGIFSGNKASAEKIFGAALSYKYIALDTYQVQLTVYGECMGVTFSANDTSTPYITVYQASTQYTCIPLALQIQSSGAFYMPVCLADTGLTNCSNASNSIIGVKQYVYTAKVNISTQNALWRFVWNGGMMSGSASRSLSLTNINSTSVIALADTLNNMNGQNNSPVNTNQSLPVFYNGYHYQYNPAAVDPDGDSLMYCLVPGKNGTGTECSDLNSETVNYTSPATGTAPLLCNTANGFIFDSTDGQMSFIPNVTQKGLVVYNTREYRSGVMVGTSQLEMSFVVMDLTTGTADTPKSFITNNSSGIIADSVDVDVLYNAGAFTFQLNPVAQAGDSIAVTWAGLPNASTFVVSGNGNLSPQGLFSWNTTGVSIGTYTFFVTYTVGTCPYQSQQTIAYKIHIVDSLTTVVSNITSQQVQIYPNPATDIVTMKIENGQYNVYTITNSIGKIVLKDALNSTQTNVNVKTLPAGIYQISLKGDSGVVVRKFVKL